MNFVNAVDAGEAWGSAPDGWRAWLAVMWLRRSFKLEPGADPLDIAAAAGLALRPSAGASVELRGAELVYDPADAEAQRAELYRCCARRAMRWYGHTDERSVLVAAAALAGKVVPAHELPPYPVATRAARPGPRKARARSTRRTRAA